MKIWILKEGQKSGPHHDFEIRSMISDQEISADQLAWYEGLEAWKPIGEIELFEDAFPKAQEAIQPEEQAENNSSEEETETESKRKYTPEGKAILTLEDGEVGIYLWRRCFVRLFEFTLLFNSFLFFHLVKGSNPVELVKEPKNLIILFITWALLENFCLHFLGTTIGKAMFGMRVERHDSKNLTLTQSVIRSLIAISMIFLCLDPVFALFTLVASIIFSKFRHALPWDIYARSRSRALPMTKMRVAAIIMFLFTSLVILSACTPKDKLEEMQKTLEEMKQETWKQR